MHKTTSSINTIIDFKELLFKVINNWYYFLLSLILSLIIAYAYTRYVTEHYKASIKILIDEETDNTSASEVLYQIQNTQKESVQDETETIKRYELVKQTVSDLRFDVTYFDIGNVKTTETYLAPIKILVDLQFTQENPNISIDIEVIEIGKKYSEEKGIAMKWIEMPIQNWGQKIDTIIMNPPFGAQRPGADREFIKKALEMAEKVWTIHLSDSGKFIEKFVEDNGGKIVSSWKMDMELKRTMKHHTKESKKVKAILYHLASLI